MKRAALATCALAAAALGACGQVSNGVSSGVAGAAGSSPMEDGAAGATGATGGLADAAVPSYDVGPVTYYKDVQPILAEHCQMCHVEGGIAPFALGTYDDARPTAALMAAATSQHIMPPWMPAQGCGDFRDARVITDEQIATIGAWSAQGAPAGDPNDATTTPPGSNSGPDLGAPGATLDPGADYHPNDALTDDYHCTLIDPGLAAEQDLIGFNVHPGSTATVHHVLLFAVTSKNLAAVQAEDAAEAGPGWTCFGGTGVDATPVVGGWVPGSGATAFPAPTGIHLDAGTQIVMQIHYNLLTVKHVTDRTTADLFYSATPVLAQNRAAITPVANTTFVIPANTIKTVSADYAIGGALSFNLWGVVPHMHLHGTDIKVQIQHADGSSTCAVEIPKWNFHWQQFYYYQQPTKVVPGDKVHLDCTFDNMAADEPIINGAKMTSAPLRWGEKTTDEMCLNYLYVTLAI
jgi:copper type II ascorbate-dependent monooxygenase-like protein